MKDHEQMKISRDEGNKRDDTQRQRTKREGEKQKGVDGDDEKGRKNDKEGGEEGAIAQRTPADCNQEHAQRVRYSRAVPKVREL